nr:hypothetical protein OG296_21755 [Streptomyces sp. NBC_01001]
MARGLLRRYPVRGRLPGPGRRLRRSLRLLLRHRPLLPALDMRHPPGTLRLRLCAAVSVPVVAAVVAPLGPLTHAA